MTYSSILVCLSELETVDKLVATACQLASGSTPHIFGVHVLPGAEVYASAGSYIPVATITSLGDHYQKNADAIKEAFEAAMKKLENPITWEWCQHAGAHLGDHTPYINHALVSDLTVTMQPAPKLESSGIAHTLLLHSGTPVVVVPQTGEFSQPAKRICVGWNETAESARAVRDALPLLQQADSVEVLWIGKGTRNTTVHGVDLARYLSQHGINAAVKNMENGAGQHGTQLLEHAAQANCDLLVMGGFGHSSVYNLVFGAATPQVLKNMNIALFLSH